MCTILRSWGAHRLELHRAVVATARRRRRGRPSGAARPHVARGSRRRPRRPACAPPRPWNAARKAMCWRASIVVPCLPISSPRSSPFTVARISSAFSSMSTVARSPSAPTTRPTTARTRSAGSSGISCGGGLPGLEVHLDAHPGGPPVALVALVEHLEATRSRRSRRGSAARAASRVPLGLAEARRPRPRHAGPGLSSRIHAAQRRRPERFFLLARRRRRRLGRTVVRSPDVAGCVAGRPFCGRAARRRALPSRPAALRRFRRSTAAAAPVRSPPTPQAARAADRKLLDEQLLADRPHVGGDPVDDQPRREVGTMKITNTNGSASMMPALRGIGAHRCDTSVDASCVPT